MIKRILAAGLSATFMLNVAVCDAYESDVHYGLTRWLALQAGFTAEQATTIATGDQLMDGGMIQSQFVELDYACIGRNVNTARAAQTLHYPSTHTVPSEPYERIVAPTAPPATAELNRVLSEDPEKSAFMLMQFGIALHTLQDAWAHSKQAFASVEIGHGLTCDRNLVTTSVPTGDDAHIADLVSTDPSATVAMARDTYEILQKYPRISGIPRVARDWGRLQPDVQALSTLTTKESMGKWFESHGMEDVSFLEGVSLPDGAEGLAFHWEGRRLPAISWNGPAQADVGSNVQQFFRSFLREWVSNRDPSAALDGAAPNPGSALARRHRTELVARLRLWRMRDHGSVRKLAHANAPLTSKQLMQVAALTKKADVYVSYIRPELAFLPLMPDDKRPVPIVPFLIYLLPPLIGEDVPRYICIAKLRHAPYDEFAIVATFKDGTPAITDVFGISDN